MIVYKITNTKSGRSYVGITTQDLATRVQNHRRSATKGTQILYRAIRKHGWSAFTVTVLCECASIAELLVAERALISAHGTYCRAGGYNMTLGGDGTFGYRQSAAVVNARRARLTGRKISPEVVERVRLATIEANKRPEVKAKKSDAAKKLWATPGHREKQKAARTGNKRGPMRPDVLAALRARAAAETPEAKAARIGKSVAAKKAAWLSRAAAAFLLCLLVFGASLHARATPVDTALVIAIDTSASINDERYELQRTGIAEAVESQQFMNAVTGGMIGRTAISVMQWSEDSFVAIDWRIIVSRADARKLAAEIRGMPRMQATMTCVAKAISAATALLIPWTEDATRRVIDVSGDGKDGCGQSGRANEDGMRAARGIAAGLDITINGLPIINDEADVAEWYGANVIGGPGSFMEVADSYADFGAAMKRKLVQEIASR